MKAYTYDEVEYIDGSGSPSQQASHTQKTVNDLVKALNAANEQIAELTKQVTYLQQRGAIFG